MTKILWQWQVPNSSPPDSYNLYTGTSVTTQTLRQSGITDLYFNDSPVTIGLTYWGYVTAVKNGIESVHSNLVSIFVAPEIEITVPVLIAFGRLIGSDPKIEIVANPVIITTPVYTQS